MERTLGGGQGGQGVCNGRGPAGGDPDSGGRRRGAHQLADGVGEGGGDGAVAEGAVWGPTQAGQQQQQQQGGLGGGPRWRCTPPLPAPLSQLSPCGPTPQPAWGLPTSALRSPVLCLLLSSTLQCLVSFAPNLAQ